MRPVLPQPSGEALVLLSAAVTLQLARGRSSEELELLSAFFSALGEQLALVAARRACPPSIGKQPG
ncbi:DUF6774 domain-containing protein [uncultured Intestinimonas sp.]|uniref:DUF6774 domain-containing protein n=2 Tax=uncultured Intestinimonas sp. TaxID=1689265 RepID=UPI0025E2CFAF|nr:DUF6774 domain-containing protein [uncultured Intestinimonas sp.]